MKLLFSIGPLNIYFFGLMIAIGSLAGIYVAVKEAKRKGLDGEKIFEGCLYALVGGFLGARLMYVFVYNPGYYLANPVEIIMINKGGLSIHGGILGGALAAIFYFKKSGQHLWKTADALAPGLTLAQAIARVGCDVFGKVMTTPLPWGIKYNGNLVHPAQAYEFVLDYFLFFYLWQKRKNPQYDGQIFVHYLIIYAVIRGIVEFARINPVIFAPFSVSHVLSAVMIATGIVLAVILRKNKIFTKKKEKNNLFLNLGITILLIVSSLALYYKVQG
ncbi:MAG: prolipoprotein diacylglyceryl transferase [Clostridiales bacterium]|jgi:phosphatidylglycerol:prolipoprotein diacylglycerol transferase|nr:prolipoprotein diacylglyceryl transferase [Clostridiales bacterium]